MKIVHVIDDLSCGGAEKACVELCNYFSGISEVYLICLFGQKEPSRMFFLENLSRDVYVIFLDKKVGLDKSLFLKMYKVLRNIKPNLINFHLGGMIYAVPYLLINKKIPAVYTLHANDSLTSTRRRRIIYRSLLKMRPVFLLANSGPVMNCNNEKYHFSVPAFIHLGISKMNVTPHFDEVLAEIRRYKSNSDTKVLITVANLIPVKDHHLLLNVFKKLRASKNIILLVLGSENNPDYSNRLKMMDCSGVHFLGVKHNISDYLAASDYFCLTSKYEGLSLATIEAMSVGLIPVCTPAGGITDLLKDGCNGFLSAAHSEECYLESLSKAINLNENERSLIMQNAIHTYERNFSIEECGSKYLELYRELVKSQ